MKHSITLIALMLIAVQGFTQNSFRKIFPQQNGIASKGIDALQTPDGGYAVLSSHYDNNTSKWYASVSRLTGIGDSVWSQIYNGVATGGNFAMDLCIDGSILIGGNYDVTSNNIALGKLDNSGNYIGGGATIYDIDDEDNLGSIAGTKDSGCIVGISASPSSSDNYIVLLKLKKDLSKEWQKIVYNPAGYSCEINTVKQLMNGGYVIVGTQYAAKPLGFMVKLNSSGDTVWTKTWDGFQPYDVVETNLNSLIAVGNGTSFQATKINTTGSDIWTKNYFSGHPPLYATFYGVDNTADGNFIMTGSAAQQSGIRDFLFMKADANGAILWNKKFVGTGNTSLDGNQYVATCADGGFLTAAPYFYTPFQSKGQTVLYKTNAKGEIPHIHLSYTAPKINIPIDFDDGMGNFGSLLFSSMGNIQDIDIDYFLDSIPPGTTSMFGMLSGFVSVDVKQATGYEAELILPAHEENLPFGIDFSDLVMLHGYDNQGTPSWESFTPDSRNSVDGDIQLKKNKVTKFSPWAVGYVKKNGINDLNASKQNLLHLYPNPSNGNFTIDLSKIAEKINAVSIYDMQGRKLKDLGNPGGEKYMNIMLDEMPSGIYICKIQGVSINTQQSISVQR